MSLSERMTTVGTLPVHYWEDGEANGRALLLLHGAYGPAYTQWASVISQLADEFRVIAPDLPGYGQSSPLHRLRLATLVEWTQQFLTTLKIEQAVIIGHSFGALVARIFAAGQPKKVPAVIMVDGGIIPKVPPLARLIAQTPLMGGVVFRRIGKSSTAKGRLEGILQMKDALPRDFYTQTRANAHPLAVLMRGMTLSKIPDTTTPRVPVMLMWGEEDSVASLKVAEYIKASIPGATLSVIAGCGHMPHIETPEVFVFQIRKFLNELSH